jgi:hypothetical protein
MTLGTEPTNIDSPARVPMNTTSEHGRERGEGNALVRRLRTGDGVLGPGDR